MDNFGLYLVITNPVTSYGICTEAAVRANIAYVQLRMKNASREDIVREGRIMREITRGTSTRFIMNDDPELACEVEADGVHLGQDDMSLIEARKKYPTFKIFGLSTHSYEQMLKAKEQSPDYIGVGPVYATPTKAIPDPVLGPQEAGRIIANAPYPAVAIGGIDTERLPEVLKAGARNYSVVRAVCGAEDPYAAICKLQDIWNQMKA